MSLIQVIDGVPAYSTIEEALSYGATYGISGYHTHTVQGQTIYMAGTTHDEITSIFRLGTQPVSAITPRATSSGGGGSSSGGGGGGY
mgnify:CR=1 FL=1|tara:strand:+ start:2457 stop:2717 length:261 start_codon:yes stop_codon:yes gene_type:complete